MSVNLCFYNYLGYLFVADNWRSACYEVLLITIFWSAKTEDNSAFGKTANHWLQDKAVYTLQPTIQIVGTSFEIWSVEWSVWRWVTVYHPDWWMIRSRFVHTLHSTLQIVGTSFEILSDAWSVWHWMRVTSIRVLKDQNLVLPALWPNG